MMIKSRYRWIGAIFGLVSAGVAAQSGTPVTNSNNGVAGAVPVYSGSATLGSGSSSPITVSGSNVGIVGNVTAGAVVPTTPIAVANGGCGATTANGCLANLGAKPVWNVVTYGAQGFPTDDTVAINATVSACEAGGGGTVVFPYMASGYLVNSQAAFGNSNQVPAILLQHHGSGVSCSFDGGGNAFHLRSDAAFMGTMPYPPNAYSLSPYTQTPITGAFGQGSTTLPVSTTSGMTVGDKVWWGYGVIPNQTPLGLEPYYFGYATITALVTNTSVTLDTPMPAAPPALVTNGLYKVTMTSGGSGYSSGDTCSFADSTGTGATCVLMVTSGVAAAYISAPGSNYTSPTLNIITSTGSGASATIIVATGYLVAGLNGTWIVSQNATITDVQSSVYQNASVSGFHLVTDIANGGDAEEGIICTFCQSVKVENIQCDNAAGAGCVYPHYSENVSVKNTLVTSSQEQDGNRAKGRCIGIAKANNTLFDSTWCNKFDTGGFVSEDPNTNVLLTNLTLNDTSPVYSSGLNPPYHCHGNSCANQMIAGGGRITVDGLTLTGFGDTVLFQDQTGTSVPEFKNVTMNTAAPMIIYDPILAHMTGFLNIGYDHGGNMSGAVTATAGSGMTPGTYYAFATGCNGVNAYVAITVTAGGTVPNNPTIMYKGSGYTCAPTITMPGAAGGTPATFTTTITAGGNSGMYLAPRTKYGACTANAGATVRCALPSGILRGLYLLPDSNIGSATSVQVITGYGTGTVAYGLNMQPYMTANVMYNDSSNNATASYDTSYYTSSTNYKNQANRELQITNTSGTSATTITYFYDYWPAIVQDGTDNVGQDVSSSILPATVVQTGQSNTFSSGIKQTFPFDGTHPPLNLGCNTPGSIAAVAGDIWCNSTNSRIYVYTPAAVTQELAYLSDINALSGTSATWNNSGTAIAANTCIDGPTATVTGVTSSNVITVTPAANFGLGLVYSGLYSTANTVQVVVCNVTTSSITIGTPHSFNVRAN